MQTNTIGNKSRTSAVAADFIALLVLALAAGIAASIVLGGVVLLLSSEPRSDDSLGASSEGRELRQEPRVPTAEETDSPSVLRDGAR